MTNPKALLYIAATSLLLVGFVILALSLGNIHIPFVRVLEVLSAPDLSSESFVISEVRLPRVLGAVCIGASLALSGALYQGVIGNPLVSPGILGVLNGASFGAALGMILGLNLIGLELVCFVCGLLAMCVALGLSYAFDRYQSVLMLILGGVISSAFFGAGVSVLKLLAYVPQMSPMHLPFSLLEVVMMGRFHKRWGFGYTRQDRLSALENLEALNLAHLAHTDFSLLSGGQKQLGLIARALCQDAQILLLDEPVSALDISYSFRLLDIIASLDKTIILTSHHPEQCFIASKILMLQGGKSLYYGLRDEALQQGRIDALYGIKSVRVDLPNGGRYFCQTRTPSTP